MNEDVAPLKETLCVWRIMNISLLTSNIMGGLNEANVNRQMIKKTNR